MSGPTTASRHVALLRGINVGRAKRIAMADLRAGVESLGYGGVRTLLNSGNVVFTAPGAGRRAADEAASRIEAMLTARLGVAARVTVLTAAELTAIVAGNPLLGVAHDPARLLIAILNDRTHRPRLAPLLERDWAPEALAAGERAAYLWCCEGILASPVAEALGKILRDGVTTRNWSTILKLHALAQDEGRQGTVDAS
jgi:uncharacterized protein (DUF1697 family)